MGEWPQQQQTPPGSLDWNKLSQQVMSNPNVQNSLSLKPSNQIFGAIPDIFSSAQRSFGSTNQATFSNLPADWTLNSISSISKVLPLLESISVKNKKENNYPSLPPQWASPVISQQLMSPVTADENVTGTARRFYEPVNGLFPPNKISRQDSADARSQSVQNAAFVKQESMEKTESLSARKSNTVRWNSWSHEEEVFLVVSVLDRFFRRGSLASSGKGKANVDCWAEIKTMYDKICAAWHQQPENSVKPELINRSTSALCRHFKIMKVRATEGDNNGTKDGNFRKFLREWDTNYNLNGRLIPEDC